MAIKMVSFTSPQQGPSSPSDPYADAERQRAIADYIQQQSLQSGIQPYDTGRNAIGEGLTQLATALIARRAGRKADEGLSQANARTSKSNEDLIRSITNSSMGQPLNPQASAIQQALAGQDPRQVNSMLSNMALQRAIPPAPFTGELGKGAVHYTAGRQDAANTLSEPLDALSKLNADFKAGLLTQSDYEARKTELTTRVTDMTGLGRIAADLQAGKITQQEAAALKDKELRSPADSQVVPGVDATGKPVLNLLSTRDGHVIKPNVGIPAAGAANNARAQQFTDRVVSAVGEVTQGLKNMTLLPFGANTGLLGMHGSPGSNIFSTSAQALKNAVSPQEVQSFQTIIPGLAANIASIESQGLAPSVARMRSFDGLMLQPGDTGWTRLEKMANFRQNADQGINAKLRNPTVPQEQKDLLTSLQKEMADAIPYTFADVQKLKQAKNPQLTLGDFGRSKGLGGPSAGAGEVTASDGKGNVIVLRNGQWVPK